MFLARRVRAILLVVLSMPLMTFAVDFDNPLAAIAAQPQLSGIYNLLKKSGYAEPMSTGGDITFLALSDTLLSKPAKGSERFSTLELFRDKIPPEAQLLILQSLTLDGQFTPAQFEELLSTQGNGKAELLSILGSDAKFRLYRGKENNTYILEDARRNGMLIKPENQIVTQNGIVIIIDANATAATTQK